MAKTINHLKKQDQKQFPNVLLIVDALKLPLTDCGKQYKACRYSGGESDIFESIVLENQGKSRNPRQSEGPYYPSDSQEYGNKTAKLVLVDQDKEDIDVTNDRGGFSSTIQGYYEKV